MDGCLDGQMLGWVVARMGMWTMGDEWDGQMGILAMDGRAVGRANGRPTDGRKGGRITGLAMASEIRARTGSHGSSPNGSRSHRSRPH